MYVLICIYLYLFIEQLTPHPGGPRRGEKIPNGEGELHPDFYAWAGEERIYICVCACMYVLICIYLYLFIEQLTPHPGGPRRGEKVPNSEGEIHPDFYAWAGEGLLTVCVYVCVCVRACMCVCIYIYMYVFMFILI